MYSDITGIILSGGKSTRMGVNKSFMLLKGEPIIARLISLMNSMFKKVLLITNNPEEYADMNIETYGDFYSFKGPLAGIHSALVNSKTEKNFIISCDIPLITRDVITFITNYKTQYPVTLLKADGYVQHLCGIYKRQILPYAADMLTKNGKTNNIAGCKMTDLISKVGAEIIDCGLIPFYEEGTFLNLNRPEDYELLLSKIG